MAIHPYGRKCGGTPASPAWEAELPNPDPRISRTVVKRVPATPAQPGCGHSTSSQYIGVDRPDRVDGFQLFKKGGTVYICSNCDQPPAPTDTEDQVPEGD